LKHGGYLCFGILLATSACLFVGASNGAAQTKNPQSNAQKPTAGVLSGVVRDSSGVAQLGASVQVSSETPGEIGTRQFLTNTQGVFRGDRLAPGFYTVQVTLAGFLPTIERHVRVASNLTTMVRIEMETMFASIEELRRPASSAPVEADDWKWVLRSGAVLRPVLQWREDDTETTSSIVIDTPTPTTPLGRLELTDGARRPGSMSNVGSAPATAFAYDLKIDGGNHIVFAGQASYDEDSPAGGLAAIWMPTGSMLNGPKSTVVLREAKANAEGAVFRGVRLDQEGTLALGDRSLVRLGGEYVLVGVNSSAWAIRPRIKWETKLSSNWYMDVVYAALPMGAAMDDQLNDTSSPFNTATVLTNALDQLDSFPVLLEHAGKPVLENGRHEEIAVERRIGPHSVLQLAGFHDDNNHVAVFGKGFGLPLGDYLPDLYSNGFAYDAGSSNDWGARAALRQKITDDLEVTAIYAFSGALVPTANLTDGALRDALQTLARQSATLSVTGKVPKVGTKITAGYKWIDGEAVSRIDPYGEGIYNVSPYLHVGIRQALPRFALGRWEATAECDNLLAQGYVPMATRDGQVYLVPAFRSFRGGLSLQF
jgi:Carboxypeptidase regulatory-like domain